jgi:hypothetical protein
LETDKIRGTKIKGLSKNEQEDAAKADQRLENCMLRFEVFELIVGVSEWLLITDYFTNSLGTNSLTVGYSDVFANSLMQKNYMKGKCVIMYPPFCNAKPFIKLAEQADEEEDSNLILLIVPKRKS